MATAVAQPAKAEFDKDLARLERLEREAYAVYAQVVWDPTAVDTARTDAFACALAATGSVLAYQQARL